MAGNWGNGEDGKKGDGAEGRFGFGNITPELTVGHIL